MTETLGGPDLDRFISVCGPGEQAVAQFVAFYLTYTREQLDALRAAIAGGSVGTVELIAHRLAGASGTCGMTPLVAPLDAIERRAREGTIDGAAALADEARIAFASIEATLRALAAGRPPQS